MTLVNDAAPAERSTGRKFRAFTAKHLDELTARAGLSPAQRLATRAVATVLPFRTNSYVLEELIDWSAAPDDPIYRLVFPQEDMLPPEELRRAWKLKRDCTRRGYTNDEVLAQLDRQQDDVRRFITDRLGGGPTGDVIGGADAGSCPAG